MRIRAYQSLKHTVYVLHSHHSLRFLIAFSFAILFCFYLRTIICDSFQMEKYLCGSFKTCELLEVARSWNLCFQIENLCFYEHNPVFSVHCLYHLYIFTIEKLRDKQFCILIGWLCWNFQVIVVIRYSLFLNTLNYFL